MRWGWVALLLVALWLCVVVAALLPGVLPPP